MTREELTSYLIGQFQNWNLARLNFEALKNVERKPFEAGDLKGYIQFNPARAVSTLAKVDAANIEKRKCFLCKTNRPSEQKSFEIIPDWELLVNPFPILPFHFTIASKNHFPQTLEIETGRKLSRVLDGMAVFYNGEGAGASAPDHAHFQAVKKRDLPLIKLLEKNWNENFENLNLPFRIIKNPAEANIEKKAVNAFFWVSEGEERWILIKRKSHRPKEFFLDPPFRRAVSPGAIDMAGVIVTPFKEDFIALTSEEVKDIYHQVSDE